MNTQHHVSQSAQQRRMHNKTLLIKVGGSILHEEQHIASLCDDVKKIKDAGYNIILVHGGSKAINDALSVYGIHSEFVDGLRVTSSAAMNVIEQVLCGQVNKLLVRKLNSLSVSAVGLSGVDQQMLLCDVYSKIHGYVGDIKKVNIDIIQHLVSLKHPHVVPVIATIGVDHEGNALNVNADMAACHIANALGVDQVIYLTDQDGIYDKQGNVFSKLFEDDLQTLITQSIVSGGMLVKTNAVLASLRAGLNQIMILNGKQKQVLLNAVLNHRQVGTLCEKHMPLSCQTPTLREVSHGFSHVS